jgi:hypothetical protein
MRRIYLGNFTQRSAFFAEVDDNTGTTILGFLDSLLDTENQIGAACADVGAEYITSIALTDVSGRPLLDIIWSYLVVNPQRQPLRRISNFGWVTKDINGQAP